MSKPLKKIYVAKNLEELNKKVSTNNKLDANAKLLMNSANSLYKKAKEAEEKDKDEELAYILYMRYVETVLACLNKAGKAEKDYYQNMLGKNRINEASQMCDKLSASLKNRYDITNMSEKLDSESKEMEKQEATKLLEKKHGERSGKKLQPTMNGVIPKNIISSEELNEKGGDIQPMQLKNLIEQKSTSILILDCRPASDFTRAHISHSNCVSIPCELLRGGLTANMLAESLKTEYPESYHAWIKRATFDRIIVYDWNSSIEHQVERTGYLIDAMTMWDPSTKYKSKPFILQGGLRNLYYTFPTLINKPQNVNEDTKKDQTAVSPNTIRIDDISYPTEADFDVDNQYATKVSHSNGHPSSIVQHNNELNSSASVASSLQKKPVIVDRTTKPAPKLTKQAYVENGIKSLDTNIIVASSLLPEGSLPNFREENSAATAALYKTNLKTNDVVGDKVYTHSNGDSSASVASLPSNHVSSSNSLSSDVNDRLQGLPSKENVKNLISNIEKNNNNTGGTSNGISNDLDLKKIIKNDVTSLSKVVGPSRPDSSSKPFGNSRTNFTSSGSGVLQRPFSTEASNLTTTKLKDENLDAPRVLKRSHSNPNLAQISIDDSSENEYSIPQFNRSLKPSTNRNFTGESHLVRRRDFQAIRSTEKTKTGLKNLGNTCYMNSIIQCINHTTELVDYFLQQEHRKHLNQRGTTKGDFTVEVAAAINEMNQGHRSIALHELKSVLSRCYKPFRNYDQQDSHEFLTFLLDWMHEDLNKAVKQPLKEQKNDNMKDEDAAENAWRDYRASNNSKIVDLFCGQQKSSVTCVTCHKASTTFDTFFILSIPIPVSPSGKKYTVGQCIDLYTSEEEINDWGCSNCKTKCRAKKKIDLWRLPPYLIIHFQRFYLENWWRKRLTDIDFPVDSLDLNRKAIGKPYCPEMDYSYNLYGVSNHYGTIEGGHYTAYCRKDRTWSKFDDSEVLSILPNNVPTSAGYILFYSRKDRG